MCEGVCGGKEANNHSASFPTYLALTNLMTRELLHKFHVAQDELPTYRGVLHHHNLGGTITLLQDGIRALPGDHTRISRKRDVLWLPARTRRNNCCEILGSTLQGGEGRGEGKGEGRGRRGERRRGRERGGGGGRREGGESPL